MCVCVCCVYASRILVPEAAACLVLWPLVMSWESSFLARSVLAIDMAMECGQTAITALMTGSRQHAHAEDEGSNMRIQMQLLPASQRQAQITLSVPGPCCKRTAASLSPGDATQCRTLVNQRLKYPKNSRYRQAVSVWLHAQRFGSGCRNSKLRDASAWDSCARSLASPRP